MKAEKEKQDKAVTELLKDIEKEFGPGAVIPLDSTKTVKVDVIPTGLFSLDFATGVGGLPKGRIVEVFGPESSGKTSLVLNIIAQVQKAGGRAAYIDVEHALDPEWAKTLGVNISTMIFSQPDGAEQALNLLQKYVESGIMDVVIMDSVAQLVPLAEAEGDMGSQHMGLQARLMSQAMRKLTPIVAKKKTLVIFINQIKTKMGGMAWGSNETTPGGRALQYASSIRIDMRKIGTEKNSKDEPIGVALKAKIVKNKVAPPFKTSNFFLLFSRGFFKERDLIETSVDYGIIEKEGNTYSFGKEKLGVGINSSCKAIFENKELYESIAQALKEHGKKDETQEE